MATRVSLVLSCDDCGHTEETKLRLDDGWRVPITPFLDAKECPECNPTVNPAGDTPRQKGDARNPEGIRWS